MAKTNNIFSRDAAVLGILAVCVVSISIMSMYTADNTLSRSKLFNDIKVSDTPEPASLSNNKITGNVVDDGASSGNVINNKINTNTADINTNIITGNAASDDSRCTSQDWVCTQWMECINGTQNRICIKKAKIYTDCNGTDGKPPEFQECVVAENASSLTGSQESNNKNHQSKYVLYGAIGLALLGILASYAIFRGKKDASEISSIELQPLAVLDKWVAVALAEGHSETELQEFLISKGYSPDTVVEAIETAKKSIKQP